MPLTTDSLVSTKLRPSQARPKLVARPRLIAKLEREASRKLTLISAPAGFGKTTLLVEWLKGRADGDQSVAWVSLDEGDNDPVRFLSYLVAALRRTVGESFGEGILAEEVLQRQAEQVQTFLLETSILDRLSGPLCDALTGCNDGQRTLERLERENLLVVPLDDDRVWYRYHHLFADFLRSRLGRESPERAGELHLRASDWYEENALVAEAVDHALSAGDHERAARLIESGIGQTWYRGEVMTLLGWLRRLPKEAMLSRPLLLVWYAAALILVGRFDGVESLLREAEGAVGAFGEGQGEESQRCADEADPQHVLATAAAVRSLHARLQGNPQGAIEHARRALALLPADNLNPRPFAALCLAEAYRAADDPEAANATFAETAKLGQAAGHDYIALTTMGSLAHLQMSQGRLREAEGSLRQALEFAVERGAELLPAVGRVRIGMGELLYEWDDLEASERELALGTGLVERAGELEILARGQVALSRVKWAQDDAEGALKLAHEAERLARESGTPQAIADAALWKARLHLMGNELRAAASDLERASDVGDVPRYTRESERVSLARLLIAREDHDEALQLLDSLREMTGAADRRGSVIEILTLQALALRAKDRKSRASDVMGQALALAEPEGYVRTFVDEGPAMLILLSETLEARQRGRLDPANKVSAHYLRKLLAALERDASGAALPAAGLPEALSERELEVLQLIAAGKTNRRIATELYVSVGTVKTHLNNLYRKLDAHSRTQALARARELNLL